MNQLAGALVGKHNHAVLVCGGAPSLPDDIAALRLAGFDFQNATIVSGNEHAVYAGLKPQYIAINDDMHTVLQRHQEPRIRELAPYAKLLSRHWWGDYRHPKMIKANSGLTAVLWASLMGANPIILAGFELYRGEKSYFHTRWKHESPSMARPDQFMAAQIKELKRLLEHTPVRTLSGPLTAEWPKWDPREVFRPRAPTSLQTALVEELPEARLLHVLGTTSTWENALVPRGMSFAVTKTEASQVGQNLDFVDITEQPPDEALLARAEAARAEHARITAMIAKVRSHPRSVRRGIYDGDLARIIYWTEAGDTAAAVQKRCGLPKDQVEFLVKTMGVVRAELA